MNGSYDEIARHSEMLVRAFGDERYSSHGQGNSRVGQCYVGKSLSSMDGASVLSFLREIPEVTQAELVLVLPAVLYRCIADREEAVLLAFRFVGHMLSPSLADILDHALSPEQRDALQAALGDIIMLTAYLDCLAFTPIAASKLRIMLSGRKDIPAFY